jgi:hypothetical protein
VQGHANSEDQSRVGAASSAAGAGAGSAAGAPPLGQAIALSALASSMRGTLARGPKRKPASPNPTDTVGLTTPSNTSFGGASRQTPQSSRSDFITKGLVASAAAAAARPLTGADVIDLISE